MQAKSPIKSKQEIIERVGGVSPILCAFGVSRLLLFGSFVRGDQQDGSDVDLLVEFSPGYHTFDNFMDLAFFLDDLLGRKVDVITTGALSPHMASSILQEAQNVPIAA